ncbi:hypothetical protein H5410_033468 [Solanum commersonii]|uniref:Uncharacterized protein n=1 Tax=Solanum commersonii TaxID=4109 RepID=A0A9J5YNP4_SOLCO|nr:hypothetical protein H5410_033468 [Solanum commersonii]
MSGWKQGTVLSPNHIELASTFQLPPGMKLKCPPAVVAVRAALARTFFFVKTMRPRPLYSKMLVNGALGMTVNIPLGI